MILFGRIMGIFSKMIIMDIFYVRVCVCVLQLYTGLDIFNLIDE